MNWFGFLRLLRTLYRDSPPKLDFIRRQGLLAVKIGQTYALRIDFLPEDSCRHLSRLYRHVDEVPSDDADRLIRLHAPDGWHERFAEIDSSPIASASVGQVHKGLLANGETVVVKFIKSNFREGFVKDVASLRTFLKFVLFFYPTLEKVADPMGILDTIETGTLDELDLCHEIAGQKRLHAIYESHSDAFDFSSLRFPRLYEELSNTNIMVSEYIPGKTFDELLDEGALSYDMLLELFKIHGFFMFCVGTFHGDIHPGNIILSDGKLCFIDTGAISTVTMKLRKGLFEFFEALSAYDYNSCAQKLNEMAERSIEGAAYDAYREKFLHLYRDYSGSTVSDVSLTKKMMETIKLGVRSGMVFEKGMYPIIKSLMYLDGMVLRCKPDAVLVRDMMPFIDEFKKSIYAGKD